MPDSSSNSKLTLPVLFPGPLIKLPLPVIFQKGQESHNHMPVVLHVNASTSHINATSTSTTITIARQRQWQQQRWRQLGLEQVCFFFLFLSPINNYFGQTTHTMELIWPTHSNTKTVTATRASTIIASHNDNASYIDDRPLNRFFFINFFFCLLAFNNDDGCHYSTTKRKRQPR